MRKSILLTMLLSGTMDLTAACVNAYLSNGVTPTQVLTYIASGLLGKAAYVGGIEVMLIGLLAHFLIVFCCTLCFYLIYSHWRILHKSIILNALLVGVVAWLVTTQVVMRFSQIGPQPFVIGKALVAVTILFFCIGLPIAWRAKLYFKKARA
ncbi:MAG: hypothetical protein J0L66_07890 [Cytophagales bacterium]|nr:hypothetical protein [Cytophagales bacterium]